LSAGAPLVSRDDVDGLVRRLIAETLVVDADRVRPDTALIAELGAESIDFLDLMFRLDEELGVAVPFNRWSGYLEARFGTLSVEQRITPLVVAAFAEAMLKEAASETA
jgi:acyl carrier protein